MINSPLEGLNSEQYEAAKDIEGAVLVTAGAGSGKTRMLTRRIAYLIQELNVSPYNILAITFTNKAADEMRNRISSLVEGSESLWISTFHAMCAKILRRHATKLGYSSSFTIYATDETERTVKAIIKELKIDQEGFYKKAVRCISEAKNDGLSPQRYLEDNANLPDIDLIYTVFNAYEDKLKNNNAMDFDDLLLKTYELFENFPDVLLSYSGRFRYILVDEFQDTNIIQYGLVKMLAESYGNVFVVGDEDQSIYGWRGADVTNMQNFVEDFGAKIYKLEQNYRSTESILKAANNLIGNNISRIKKTLWSENGKGEPIAVQEVQSEFEEADYVVNVINKLMREGHRPHDFAVLMRVNALTRQLEQRFMQYNIPYKVYGGFKFYDRKEVKDILAYLRIFSNPADDDAVLRVINFPKRGIGDGTIGKLNEYARENKLSLFDTLMLDDIGLPTSAAKKVKPFSNLLRTLYDKRHTMNVADFVDYAIKAIGILDVYAEDTEENTTRRLNIKDFISSVYEFEKNRGGTLEDFLEEVTLYTEGDDTTGDSVFLSTVHSAKGMEFRNVFIVGVEEGLFPLSRADDDFDELEEERRLMYVAITRAKERLWITHCRTRNIFGDRKISKQSRFLGEIDAKYAAKPERTYDKRYSDIYEADTYESSYSKPKFGTISGATMGNVATKQKVIKGEFKVGMRIKHVKFGEGTIVDMTNIGANSYVVIDFDKLGKMTLSLAFAPIQKI